MVIVSRTCDQILDDLIYVLTTIKSCLSSSENICYARHLFTEPKTGKCSNIHEIIKDTINLSRRPYGNLELVKECLAGSDLVKRAEEIKYIMDHGESLLKPDPPEPMLNVASFSKPNFKSAKEVLFAHDTNCLIHILALSDKFLGTYDAWNNISIWEISDPSKPIWKKKIERVTCICLTTSDMILGFGNGMIRKVRIGSSITESETIESSVNSRIDRIDLVGTCHWFLSGQVLYRSNPNGEVDRIVDDIYDKKYKVFGDESLSRVVYWAGGLDIMHVEISGKKMTKWSYDLNGNIEWVNVVEDISEKGLVLLADRDGCATLFDPIKNKMIVKEQLFFGEDNGGRYRFVNNQSVKFSVGNPYIIMARPGQDTTGDIDNDWTTVLEWCAPEDEVEDESEFYYELFTQAVSVDNKIACLWSSADAAASKSRRHGVLLFCFSKGTKQISRFTSGKGEEYPIFL